MAKLRYHDRRNWAKLSANKSQAAQLVRRGARSALQEDSWKSSHGAKLGGILMSLLVDAARVEVRRDGTLEAEHTSQAEGGGAALGAPSAGSAAAGAGEGGNGVLPAVPSALSRTWEQLYGLSQTTPAAAAAAVKASSEAAKAAAGAPVSGPAPADPDVDSRVEFDEATGVGRVTVPAFRHLYLQATPRNTVGVLVLNPRMTQLLQGSAGRFSHPTHKAMLVPPTPWTGPTKGGYLKQRTTLLRVAPGTRTQLEAVRTAEMPRVYDALTALGNTAWRIHPLVYRVLKEVWARGGGLAEVPSRENVPVPEAPSAEELGALAPKERAAALRRHRAAAKRALQTNANRHSLRCDLELKLHEAESFASDEMYFPWNLDFRGRCCA